MERELNKLFNDTNYDKEIWSIKLEFPNFFEEFSIGELNEFSLMLQV